MGKSILKKAENNEGSWKREKTKKKNGMKTVRFSLRKQSYLLT